MDLPGKRKVDAGADYICTQLFFENRDFYDFRERCDLAGIKVPIVAGIMPITSAKMGMGRRPRWLPGRTTPRSCSAPSAAALTTTRWHASGISWATEQCADLLHNNVRGIHFYTLNKSDATRQIYQNLGVESSAVQSRLIAICRVFCGSAIF